jgi:hypothetical protein
VAAEEIIQPLSETTLTEFRRYVTPTAQPLSYEARNKYQEILGRTNSLLFFHSNLSV